MWKSLYKKNMNIEEEIFQKYIPDFSKLIEYGFCKNKNKYSFEKIFYNNEFRTVIEISKSNKIVGKIYDIEANDEFLLIRLEHPQGAFVGQIKEAYEKFEDFDYYAFSDQDDVWLEDKLLSAVKKLDTVNGQVSDKPISYCSATTLVDNNLVPLKRKSKKYTKFSITKSNCLLQSCATGCTMLFNKKALYLYATHMPSELYAHDMMMYQMCVYLGQVVYDTNSYILYRQHGNNQIGSNNAIGRMKKRLEYNKHAGTLQHQAQRLLELYKDQMTLIDIAIVSKLAFYKENLFTKLSLLFDSKYRYKSMESNLFYFLKIILGGV